MAAAARLEQAAAEARIASAALQPTVQASYTGSRRKQNFVGFPIPGLEGRVLTTVSTNQGVSLDLSWEVDLWGRLRADAQAALADLQRSAADLRGAQLSKAGQTVKAWFAIAEARQQVTLSDETVASFRASAEQVRERFESGIRPALDLRLALLNLANAQALLDQRRQQLDASARQLDVLLGRYAAGTLEQPSRLPDVTADVPGGIPADLVARRPDLVAAERQVAAAGARLGVARTQLLPNITLTAATGTATNALRSLLDGDFGVWSLLGNVVAPLWQGGRLRAQIDRAEAQTAEALASYANTALVAYAEVETALAAEGVPGRPGRPPRECGRAGTGSGATGRGTVSSRPRQLHHRARLAALGRAGRRRSHRGTSPAAREPRRPVPSRSVADSSSSRRRSRFTRQISDIANQP